VLNSVWASITCVPKYTKPWAAFPIRYVVSFVHEERLKSSNLFVKAYANFRLALNNGTILSALTSSIHFFLMTETSPNITLDKTKAMHWWAHANITTVLKTWIAGYQFCLLSSPQMLECISLNYVCECVCVCSMTFPKVSSFGPGFYVISLLIEQ